MEHSSKPIIATHSCAYSLCDHPRNLRDDQLKALKKTGGFVGVNFPVVRRFQFFRMKVQESNS
ncbi:MAG: membrane dipeptidase [Acidaminococcaceae bacterium]|nr:membrane dipeptidase [Acidaminococcaceae bacterium]MBR1591030.1 membrane dipeptidase [Acidaminococcaceae bacterium]MBR2183290.1 membrane dipeptidase [Acidaminococcaceae bacterium]